MSTIEVELLTVNDRGNLPGRDFDYPRIAGFTDPEAGVHRWLADLPYHLAESVADERRLELPVELGSRFLDVLGSLVASRHPKLSCHAFARAMTGFPTLLDPAIHHFDWQTFAEVQDMRLGMGAVGIIGSPEEPLAFHSLVGLGEDSDESLQSLSAGGELTLVETWKVAESYRRNCDSSSLYLYEPSPELEAEAAIAAA